MAVSLVSTGVQFPDSTIQTTAATAAPSVTTQWSVIGSSTTRNITSDYDTPQYATVSFTPAGLAAGVVYTLPNLAPTNTSTPMYTGKPFWSSYYNAWFMIQPYTAVEGYSQWWIMKSVNGLNWTPTCLLPSGTVGSSGFGFGGGSILGVDETNGRFFLALYNGIIWYSSISDTANLNLTAGWTQYDVAAAYGLGGLYYPGNATYCKMSSTGNSGLVVTYVDYQNILYVFTLPAGGTTGWSLRLSYNVGTSTPGQLAYQENGKIVIVAGSRALYTTAGSIASGWTSAAVPSAMYPQTAPAVGNGYMVYIPNNYSPNLYYSTDGSTWTGVTVGTSNTKMQGVFYNGSIWIAWDIYATYASSSGVPSTWSMYSGGVNSGRYTNLFKRFGQRVVA